MPKWTSVWGTHEWFRIRDANPTDICCIANAFQPCLLYDDKVVWWPTEDVPFHLKAVPSLPPTSLPPTSYIILYDVNDTPFLRLNTVDLNVVNRVMFMLEHPPVAHLLPAYKVNKF